VEMPCELVRARFACIPAISPFLLGRQERDRHLFSRRAACWRASSYAAAAGHHRGPKRAIDAGAADAKPTCNGGRSKPLLISQAPDFGTFVSEVPSTKAASLLPRSSCAACFRA
jgi:hypothetical protein